MVDLLAMDIFQKGLEWLEKTPKPLLYSFAAIGAAPALLYVGTYLRLLWQYKCRQRLDLASRYGPKSYVLITGASEGIGKSLAYEFAKLGFNLVLLARRAPVLQDIKTDIERRYNVSVETVAYDLSLGVNPQDLYTHVVQPLASLDVSILVNNAALITEQWFVDVSGADLLNLLNVNIKALTFLTHFLTPKLALRPYRSGVINLNSFSGLYPLPFASIYSGSKSYLRSLSAALATELSSSNLDILNSIVGLTATRMTGYRKYLTSAEEVASSVLLDLGSRSESLTCFAFAKQVLVNDNQGFEQVIAWSKAFYPIFARATLKAKARIAASNPPTS